MKKIIRLVKYEGSDDVVDSWIEKSIPEGVPSFLNFADNSITIKKIYDSENKDNLLDRTLDLIDNLAFERGLSGTDYKEYNELKALKGE